MGSIRQLLQIARELFFAFIPLSRFNLGGLSYLWRVKFLKELITSVAVFTTSVVFMLIV